MEQLSTHLSARDSTPLPARTAHELAYSPSSVAPGFMQTVAEYASRSRAALDGLTHAQLAYGPWDDEYLLVFRPREPVDAVMVFIHGGYWQELSAEESCFPAPSLVERGQAYAAVNYTLAPHATVAAMVEQCVAAVDAMLVTFPLAKLVVVGSSAGAHLAAMVNVRLAERSDARPRPAGYVLISGIYDLRPLVGTYINQPLALDLESAAAISPLRRPVSTAPLLICWGEFETEAFKRQSRDYATALQDRTTDVQLSKVQMLEVAGRNHFDILFDMAEPRSLLGHAMKKFTGDL